jgi:hypothetical protein
MVSRKKTGYKTEGGKSAGTFSALGFAVSYRNAGFKHALRRQRNVADDF